MSIEKLWKDKKWLFFLLLPVVALVYVAQLWEKYQALMAGKALSDAEDRDSELQDQTDSNQDSIDAAEEEIADIQETIDDLEVDDDWNKDI